MTSPGSAVTAAAGSTGDFVVDLIVVIAVVWLMLMPLIVGAGILEFCEWREKRLREGPRHG